jgi:hypothetical protein
MPTTNVLNKETLLHTSADGSLDGGRKSNRPGSNSSVCGLDFPTVSPLPSRVSYGLLIIIPTSIQFMAACHPQQRSDEDWGRLKTYICLTKVARAQEHVVIGLRTYVDTAPHGDRHLALNEDVSDSELELEGNGISSELDVWETEGNGDSSEVDGDSEDESLGGIEFVSAVCPER